MREGVAAFGARVRGDHPAVSFYISMSVRKGDRKPRGFDDASRNGELRPGRLPDPARTGGGMIRQYGAQRRRGGVNPLGVGVIAAGSIYYLQDRDLLRSPFRPPGRVP